MTAKAAAYSMNRDIVVLVGSQILAAQLTSMRDPIAMASDHLDRLADMAVRSAVAFDQAIPRAEERMAAEQKAAEEAAAAEEKAAANAGKSAAEAAKLAEKEAADTVAMQAAAAKTLEKETAAAANKPVPANIPAAAVRMPAENTAAATKESASVADRQAARGHR